ncbi:hypothetical protein AB0941_42260 [Streptomyces sp. NPDC013433]
MGLVVGVGEITDAAWSVIEPLLPLARDRRGCFVNVALAVAA